jgi:outer membrane lipoprotein SlyB
MRIPIMIIALASAVSFAAPASATERGVVGGAVVGGTAGALVGGPVGAVVGAGAGAVVGGGMTGHRYYHRYGYHRYGSYRHYHSYRG